MKTSRTPESACPGCQKVLDAATHPGSAKPKPDDLTMCLYCGEILKFDRSLKPVAIDPKELEQIQRDEPNCYLELIRVKNIVRSRLGGDRPADTQKTRELGDGEQCPECNSFDTATCLTTPDWWRCLNCLNEWEDDRHAT